MSAIARIAALTGFAVLACFMATGQQGAESPGAGANGCATPLNWTAEQDHQNMMEQLGIRALRPGPSGNEKAPNHANYDESRPIRFRTCPMHSR